MKTTRGSVQRHRSHHASSHATAIACPAKVRKHRRAVRPNKCNNNCYHYVCYAATNGFRRITILCPCCIVAVHRTRARSDRCCANRSSIIVTTTRCIRYFLYERQAWSHESCVHTVIVIAAVHDANCYENVGTTLRTTRSVVGLLFSHAEIPKRSSRVRSAMRFLQCTTSTRTGHV